jgi:hypothetical protein
LPPDLTARPAECLGHACGYAHQEQIFVTDWIAFYTLICTVDVIERWEAPEQLSALVDSVMELNVKSGIANSLDDKLASALEAVDDVNEQNDVSACNRTQAFINTVEAQRGTQITDVDADALIAAAQEIIEALSCQ